MVTRISSLFRGPAPRLSKFVLPGQLTAFQRESWHRSAPIMLSNDKMDALAVFFARSLRARWSFVDAESPNDGVGRYIVLLEAETEAIFFDIFRTVAESGATRRLNRG